MKLHLYQINYIFKSYSIHLHQIHRQWKLTSNRRISSGSYETKANSAQFQVKLPIGAELGNKQPVEHHSLA